MMYVCVGPPRSHQWQRLRLPRLFVGLACLCVWMDGRRANLGHVGNEWSTHKKKTIATTCGCLDACGVRTWLSEVQCCVLTSVLAQDGIDGRTREEMGDARARMSHDLL